MAKKPTLTEQLAETMGQLEDYKKTARIQSEKIDELEKSSRDKRDLYQRLLERNEELIGTIAKTKVTAAMHEAMAKKAVKGNLVADLGLVTISFTLGMAFWATMSRFIAG